MPDADLLYTFLVDTPKCAMLAVDTVTDTLLMKEGDVDVLGLDESIIIAIAGDPKRFCHLPALHGKMLGEINGRLEAHEEKMCCLRLYGRKRR